VLLSAKVRSACETRLWSSVAVTEKRHRPSAARVDTAVAPLQLKRYVPGARAPESIGIVVPSGPTSVA
jgi:hypothetical protein